ncbi:MAG: hypothetical protein LBG97_02335, partial [Coriobacteriales bacterium]|nr:hypothetical protein [Coriobacteriales bacterium]
MKKHNFGNLHTLSDTKMACDTQSVHAKISSSKRRFGKGMSGKPLFGTCGATLVWAVVVGVVLLIITGTIAMVVSRSYTNTATSSHNTQAYYTARSINESIVNWLQNTPAQSYSGTVSGSSSGTYANAGSGSSSGTYANADGGSSSKVGNNANELNDQQLFINDLIAAGSIHEHYDSADLGGTMGAADINITINDEHDEITVTTVSDYNGETHRIVSRLNAQEDSLFTYETGGDFSLQPTFDEHSYDSIIANINTGSNGFASDLSPVNIQLRAPNGQNASSYGENNVATTKRDYNVENRATLANLIASDNLTREATMRETTTLYGTNYSTGPADFPWIGGSLRNNTTT